MKKILIINSNFYKDISSGLLEGCIEILKSLSIDFDISTTLGSFEIPAALSILHNEDKYDGYIVLGCVIRGETTHYDHICLESIRGINNLAIKYKLALGNGIITVENKQQALDRIKKDNNKGSFAAQACLQMIEIKKNKNN